MKKNTVRHFVYAHLLMMNVWQPSYASPVRNSTSDPNHDTISTEMSPEKAAQALRIACVDMAHGYQWFGDLSYDEVTRIVFDMSKEDARQLGHNLTAESQRRRAVAINAIEEAGVVENAEAKGATENIVGENGTENVKGEEEKEEGVDVAQEEDNAARDETTSKINLRVAIIFLALLAAVPVVMFARRKFNKTR